MTCGLNEFEFLERADDEFLTTLCGRDAVQVKPPNAGEIDFDSLRMNLGEDAKVSVNEYLMKFETGGYEFTVFNDSRAIIKGTTNPEEARSVYARYIGN